MHRTEVVASASAADCAARESCPSRPEPPHIVPDAPTVCGEHTPSAWALTDGDDKARKG